MPSLIHLSDVHFGPPHRPQVAAELAAWIEELAPDLVVLSGDLTQRAKPLQFQQARRWVDGLGWPVLVVPGNHDVPLYRVWERALAPYGAYRNHFASELEPTFENDELLVVGVNSAHGWTFKGGRIHAAALRALDRRLGGSTPGQRKIVVVHHPLAPPPHFGPRTVARGARALLELCRAHQVEAVLSGHEHQTYLYDAGSFYPEARGILLAVTGSSCSSRGRGVERGDNSFLHLQLDGHSTVISCFLRRVSDNRFAVVRRLEVGFGSHAPSAGEQPLVPAAVPSEEAALSGVGR